MAWFWRWLWRIILSKITQIKSRNGWTDLEEEVVEVLVPLVVVALYQSKKERLDPGCRWLLRLYTLQSGIGENIAQFLGLNTQHKSAVVKQIVLKFKCTYELMYFHKLNTKVLLHHSELAAHWEKRKEHFTWDNLVFLILKGDGGKHPLIFTLPVLMG